MRSFGMWFKPINSSESVTFETHFNLWFLEDHKGLNPKIQYPYLDVGIRIENYKKLRALVIGLPFVAESNNIEDLSAKISKKENAQLLFNENCEIETIQTYTAVKLTDDNKLLVFPLKQDCGIECKVERIDETSSSKITIDFTPFISYTESTPDLKNIDGRYNSIYLRFRIKGIDLKDIVFYDSESLNKSFESAFSATRVLDFKINKSRNIDNKLIVDMQKNEFSFISFKKIHFLIMMPSAYDVVQFSGNLNCREVENDLWDDYFGQRIDFHKSHVLAYHWKKTYENEDEAEEFSCFAKINYKKTRNLMLLAYIFVVISLGMIGSALVSVIQSFGTGSNQIVTKVMVANQTATQVVIANQTSSKCLGSFNAFAVAVILFLFAVFLGSRDS